MKCAEMLVLLLEAEPEELEGRGGSVVATHVQTCARCRAVASKLRGETQLVAEHVGAFGANRVARDSAGARPLPRMAWAGAAAALILIAVLVVRREGANNVLPRPLLPASAPQTAPENGHGASAIARSPQARSGGPKPEVRVSAVRFADVAPATPVRFVASQSADTLAGRAVSSGVAVIPPPGRSAAVLETRNAKITVVWLY